MKKPKGPRKATAAEVDLWIQENCHSWINTKMGGMRVFKIERDGPWIHVHLKSVRAHLLELSFTPADFAEFKRKLNEFA